MASRRNSVKDRLATLDVRPSKGRGQNFLLNTSVAQRICQFASLESTDTVIEVGPGLGALTELLVGQVARLIVYEVEPQLVNDLIERGVVKEADIHCADIRDVSLSGLALAQRAIVVSNVPYSISTEFLLWLFDNFKLVRRAHLLLQKEYAERVTAEPGTRAYGSLTVLRARYATAELGEVVKGGEFYPPTKVDSQLLRLDFFDEKKFADIPDSIFSEVVRAAFSKRRKTLINSLTMSTLGLSKESLMSSLECAAIDPNLRAEQLSLEDYSRLVAAITESRKG